MSVPGSFSWPLPRLVEDLEVVPEWLRFLYRQTGEQQYELRLEMRWKIESFERSMTISLQKMRESHMASLERVPPGERRERLRLKLFRRYQSSPSRWLHQFIERERERFEEQQAQKRRMQDEDENRSRHEGSTEAAGEPAREGQAG